MAAATQRPYQLVVWGASGFVGKLVCEHLARDYVKTGTSPIKWAMAGRSQEKLESVREELAKINPAMRDVPILTADAEDKQALGDLLSKTQVVLSLVGPFNKYGNVVLDQAVQQGTNYCDITGEVPWVKQSVLKYHDEALKKQVKIVHCCGYDSIPSDLGVLLVAEYAQRVLNKKLSKVAGLVKGKGGASGGTIASGMNIVETTPMPELKAVTHDAYYLAPGAQRGTDTPTPLRAARIDEAGQTWAGPGIMEACNARVVHRSNAIRPEGPYGPDFQYREYMDAGPGWKGWLGANIMSVGVSLIGMGVSLWPTRALLKRVLPAPGSGPSVETQRSGFWKQKVVALTYEPDEGKPTVIVGTAGDKRDPGYWSTSRMILEAGLALVLDADKITKSGMCLPGGVLTPSTAAGMVLIDRLRAAGMTWEVEDDAVQPQGVGVEAKAAAVQG